MVGSGVCHREESRGDGRVTVHETRELDDARLRVAREAKRQGRDPREYGESGVAVAEGLNQLLFERVRLRWRHDR
jgi:hypothetical protein